MEGTSVLGIRVLTHSTHTDLVADGISTEIPWSDNMNYYSGEGEREISETAPILVKIESMNNIASWEDRNN